MADVAPDGTTGTHELMEGKNCSVASEVENEVQQFHDVFYCV